VEWVVHVDETPGSQYPDEPNRTASAPDQEAPPYPSGAVYHYEPYKRNDANLRENLLIYSALLGISTVAMTQILPISPLDRALRVAVFAFAVTIPLLAGSIMIERIKMSEPINIDTRLEAVMNLAGILASVVGITSIVFHFGVFAGVVFLAISIFAVVAWSQVQGKLGDINHG
jgi:hypothetical protein